MPPNFPPEQRALFCEVLQHLNRAGVPYVVSGAFALQQHTGIWRDTKDLDLFLPAQAVAEALRYLQEKGLETEVRDPVWLAKAHRDGYYVDLITGMSNAVITVDQSWIDRSSHSVVLGVPTRVLAAEELIASKLFVNFRERFDGADVVHIIYGTKGRLDWQRLRIWWASTGSCCCGSWSCFAMYIPRPELCAARGVGRPAGAAASADSSRLRRRRHFAAA